MDFFERLIKMKKLIFLCLFFNFYLFSSVYHENLIEGENYLTTIKETVDKKSLLIHKDHASNGTKHDRIYRKIVFYILFGGFLMIVLSTYLFNIYKKDVDDGHKDLSLSVFDIFPTDLFKADYPRFLKNFLYLVAFGWCQDNIVASTQLLQYSSSDHLAAWYHPPTSSDLLRVTKADNETVLQLLNAYHEIPLSDLNSIKERLSILLNMQKIISSIEEQDPAYKTYRKLNGLVSKKTWYLEQLIKLYEKEDPYIDIKNVQNNPNALVLVNKVALDFKLPVFWGLFWLEAIDPCHRFLTKHYMDWEKEKTQIPFFIWLESREISFESIQVDYLEEESLNNHELIIENGFLKKKDKKLANLCDDSKEFIYALSLDKKLFVIESGNRIRHTSLTQGKPVLGAGSIKIKNGIITFIDAESGHYQPTPFSLVCALSALHELGIPLGDIQVKYYDEHGSVFFETKDLLFQKYGPHVEILS